MKNIVSLATAAEIEDYVFGLWKSDLFRDSHSRGGFIREQVAQFAWTPRMFAEMTNETLERAHFSTWWGVIMLRHYDNPIISDLYYIHEMKHAATMAYIRNIGRAAHDEKMERNELEASVFSEIEIYLAMPELRANSFDHEIYADRFLNDPEILSMWRRNRAVALEKLRFMRRDIMVSKPVEHMDFAEQWIRRFAEQNKVYSVVWTDRYHLVENAMAALQIDADGSDDDRRAALAAQRDFVERMAAQDPHENVPFRDEAALFAPFYWSNKEKFDAAVAARSSSPTPGKVAACA